LPEAHQVVLDQCGHVPQVEHPVDANALVHDFICRSRCSAAERAAKRFGRAARRLQTRINGAGLYGRAAEAETAEAETAEADAA
jgi:hypothetical protein